MQPILMPNEMYDLDNHVINDVKIPSMLLMEAAAIHSANFIKGKLAVGKSILVLCGVGNNGGDGLALVRHLSNHYSVRYVIVGDSDKFSSDSSSNYNILNKLEFGEIKLDDVNWSGFDCIVDAMLGIGSKLPLRENIAKINELVNKSQALKIAIDVPTGLDGKSGIADNNTFRANYTLTMYSAKTGLYLNDGKDYTGEVVVLDLGIPNDLINNFANIFHYSEIKNKNRINNSSKYDYAKCVVIAGSESMNGAGVLASNSAISAGAGLVYHCSTHIGNALYPEIMTLQLSNYDGNILENQELNTIVNKCDSMVVGPGLGKTDEVRSMVCSLVENIKNKVIIIDADGISALDNNTKYSKDIVITPHLGEFSKLIDKDKTEIIRNLPELVKETAEKMNINILLKGPTSVISDGEETLFVTDGVPEMATAGSGDVLCGVLAAQLPLDICGNQVKNIANAALTHINAAKIALNSKTTIKASDIIEGLQCVK